MSVRSCIQDWESKIRGGDGQSIVGPLSALKREDVDRNSRPQVAALARRVGLYREGLLLLRDDYLAERERTGNEQLVAEYAALLTEVGATQIAARLLSQFTNPTYPMTHFYKALLAMKSWDSRRAIDELLLFKSRQAEPYWQVIADLNLVSSYIAVKEYESAGRLLREIQRRQDQLPPMALGVLWEQEGELLFFANRWAEARACFERSYERLLSTRNPSCHFAKKWLLIVDLLLKPWGEVEPVLSSFKEQMRQLGFWEILRELDRYYLLRYPENGPLAKLYFGTPAPEYRAMLVRDLQWEPPAEYWHYTPGTLSSQTSYFDCQSRQLWLEGRLVSKASVQLTALLEALTADLYRPVAVGSLFEHLFEGQYFHPEFASQRVYQAISRFGRFVEREGLPLSVESAELGYNLHLGNGFALRYSLPEKVAEGTDTDEKVHLIRLSRLYGESAFTTEDIASSYGISKRTANRILEQQLKAGSLEKIGTGRSTAYRIRSKAA